MKNKLCQRIDLVVNFCKLAGNPVEEISTAWSTVKKVYYMSSPLTLDLKQKIKKEIPELEYWVATKDLHYSPDEGFICNECMESISFPVRR